MQPDPFEPLIDQLAALLKLAEQNASKSLNGPVDPAIVNELKKIQIAVQNFDETCEKAIGPSLAEAERKLKKYESHPEQLSTQDKKMIEKYRDLGVHAVILRMGLKRAKQQSEGFARKREMGKNTKKSIQKRRGKFKGMDGQGDWKRL